MIEGKTDSQATPELSETARLDLLHQCSDQFAQLEELQNVILYEPGSCPDEVIELVVCLGILQRKKCALAQEKLVSQLNGTEAELKQWLSADPKVLASNSDILVQAGIEEMLNLSSELEMINSSYEAKKNTLRKMKELEQMWLENKKKIYNATLDHGEQIKKEEKTLTETSLLQETKNDIHKIQGYLQTLMECLGNVLEKHLPPVQSEFTKTSKKSTELGENVSLKDILEVLMNKALKTPHDPYVNVDDIHWLPYVEMLLRYGIVVRHHENNFMLCLENF